MISPVDISKDKGVTTVSYTHLDVYKRQLTAYTPHPAMTLLHIVAYTA